MNYNELLANADKSQVILKNLELKIKENKLQTINLINAQFILRFAHNPWYFGDKILAVDCSNEDVLYCLKTIDFEGLELIEKYFENI